MSLSPILFCSAHSTSVHLNVSLFFKCSSSPKACTLPETSPDKYFDAVECPAGTNCKREPGKKVAEFTKLTLKCNSGYKYDDRKTFTTICSDGNWLPPIEKCDS